MLNLKYVLPFLLFCFLPDLVKASNNNTAPESLLDLMSYQEILEINLETDMVQLIEDRRSEDEVKGNLSFTDSNGRFWSWKIKVGLRGNYRRMNCNGTPPLKLNFKKGELQEAGLSKFDDMKLVTQCLEDESLAKKLLLKEYLAYKLYNQLTDKSLRVQLLKINFIDSNTGNKNVQYGFVIEDSAEFRNRIGATKMDKTFNIQPEVLDRDQFKMVALFQYMIGNIDYNLAAGRNLKMVKIDDKAITVPYDFDFSEMVKAPYRTGSKRLDVIKQGDRAFLGFPEDVRDLKETIQLFENNREALLKIVSRFSILDREERDFVKGYLMNFFDNITQIKLPPVDVYVGREGKGLRY